VLGQLKAFFEDVKTFRNTVRAVESKTIGQNNIRKKAEEIGTLWCHDISPRLHANGGFQPAMLDKYTADFSRLIKVSAPSNLKSSYLSVLDAVTKDSRKDFILPVQQAKIVFSKGPSHFDNLLTQIATSDEGDYYKEALSCAKNGYLRAATVMGWCTVVNRIHRKIEEIGFPAFNVRSAYLASQTAGRFKKFNQTQNVNSLSELRTVFDTVILWIIEGMGLIDSNQHTRLASCFDMRNQAAHPGEAPSTEYNLASFFSDINEIVLSNANFALQKPPTQK